MLKHGSANPLNVFGLRRLDHCPPHFCRIEFRCQTYDKQITDWIYENLEGRFWFGEIPEPPVKPESDSWSYLGTLFANARCAAFEVEEESSLFLLMLDQINQHRSN